MPSTRGHRKQRVARSPVRVSLPAYAAVMGTATPRAAEARCTWAHTGTQRRWTRRCFAPPCPCALTGGSWHVSHRPLSWREERVLGTECVTGDWRHCMAAEIKVGPPNITISQGRTFMLTDTNG